MEEKIKELIMDLEEVSESYYYDGTTLKGTMDNLAEYHFGVSEGIDFVTERLESLIKEGGIT